MDSKAFIKEIYVSFKLHKTKKISLKIYDTSGHLVARILENKSLDYGKHIITIPIEKYNLKSGFYFYTLESDNKVITRKMLIE